MRESARRVAWLTFALATCALASCPARGPTRLVPPRPGKPLEIPPVDPTFVQVRGRISDAAGKPVANADVLVMGGGRTASRSRTDAAGSFTAAGLPITNEGWIVVLAEGFAVAAREPVPVTQRLTQSVTLRLEPERVITGRVVDVHGAPVEHARVEVRGERKLATHARKNVTWERAAQIDTVWTGADGTFRFVQLYAGEFDVEASHADLVATSRVRAGGDAIDLRLPER